jgi:hypothetical protein
MGAQRKIHEKKLEGQIKQKISPKIQQVTSLNRQRKIWNHREMSSQCQKKQKEQFRIYKFVL